MKLLLGTTNISKFHRYKTILDRYTNIEVISLRELNFDTAKQAIEDGRTAQENAHKKAEHYAAITGLPTLSIDEALFIDGLPPEEQPGVHVRRYAGKPVSDEVLLDIYLEKTRSLSLVGRHAQWVFAVCLALPSGSASHAQVEIATVLTDQPRLPLLPGYPLSSLLMDPASGKYVRDLSQQEQECRLQPLYEGVASLVQTTLTEQKYFKEAVVSH